MHLHTMIKSKSLVEHLSEGQMRLLTFCNCDWLQNRSALWHACAHGHADVVSVLLPLGASVNDADEEVSL